MNTFFVKKKNCLAYSSKNNISLKEITKFFFVCVCWHELRCNSPEAQIFSQNGMNRSNTNAHLVYKFSDHNSTIMHPQSPYFVNCNLISRC